MKLFYLPGACSLAPHILLKEIGANYQLEKLNMADKSSLLTYNPKGAVPTLVLDDGKVLTEAAAVLQYIADLKPESNLIPKAGTWERYKCVEWLTYVSSELHKGIGILFNKEFDDHARNIFKKGMGKKLEWLDGIFSKTQYFMGNQFTAPDSYAFVTISWCNHVGIDLTPYKNVQAFLERVKTRPSTIAAIKAES
jgi:glutathione S-transferase